MPEPTHRPSLLEQKKLDKTYPQRLSSMDRQDPDLQPDLIEAKVVQEPYDQTIMGHLGDLQTYLDGLILFVERAEPAIGKNVLQGRDLPFLDKIRSIDVSKIKPAKYDAFYTAIMETSAKIDTLLEMELSNDSRQKLEELQEMLMDSLS